MTTTTRTDADITTDVLAELTWDPAATVIHLHVSTEDGHVTLYGIADSYSSKHEAARAARRISGVRGVTNATTVEPSAFTRSDADIATDVRNALYLDSQVPLNRITVEVADRVVTLRGTVDYNYQREAAMKNVRSMTGVSGVVNDITVRSPSVLEEGVAGQIASAFARNSQLADDDVHVHVEGSTAILSGTVRIWAEYYEAEDAAWRANGISYVENNIMVTY